MSTLGFWLLMLVIVLFVVAVVGVVLAARMLFRKVHRMLAELAGLSSDAEEVLSRERADPELPGAASPAVR